MPLPEPQFGAFVKNLDVKNTYVNLLIMNGGKELSLAAGPEAIELAG